MYSSTSKVLGHLVTLTHFALARLRIRANEDVEYVVNHPGKFILASVVWSAISAVAPGDSTATEYRGAAKRPYFTLNIEVLHICSFVGRQGNGGLQGGLQGYVQGLCYERTKARS